MTFSEKIEEVLMEQFGLYLNLGQSYDRKLLAETKQAIIELVKELIGEDEKLPVEHKHKQILLNSGEYFICRKCEDNEYLTRAIVVINGYRQEIINKLEEE